MIDYPIYITYRNNMALRDLNDKELDDVLEIFKALASPVRLLIARMVCERPRYGYEIEEAFDCERTNITKHVNLMKDAGLLKAYKEGRKTLFVLQTGHIKSSLLGCIEHDKLIENSKA
ncbi:ArsR family transcriptional regulator [Geovibrio thiophilus]|uniref:ArsR family transcriptional regulator n=2 Tax=Geovibrio thiophilus TaxID=139438 RepID=A0A410K0V0_9BACT|nr:ArsR family transcriptional regulator [Geovibrio thiophilus]